MSNLQERNQPITLCVLLFIACLLLCALARAAPSITLSQKSGPPTSRILVSGRGFKPNVGVDIFFDTKDEALVVTNGKGEFSDAKVHAPRKARPGKHWVTALERNNDKGAQEPFLVQTNWSQFGFDVEGTRLNRYENVLNVKNVSNLDLQWTYPTNGFIYTLPAVQDGIVYVASDKLYALDGRTGKEIWTYPISIGDSSPAVADGVVYVGSYSDDKLHALDAKTGAKLWEYSGSAIACTPTVYGGVVYFGSLDNRIYALRASNGHYLWSFGTGYKTCSAPAVANGVIYVGSADDNLYALDAKTGNKLWSYTTDWEIWISSPAVADGVVYVASAGTTVYALNASTGTLLWSYTTGGTQASIAVAHGVVYVASGGGHLYALNASTGAELWRYSGCSYSSSPAVANGVIYIGGAGCGDINGLDAKSGKLLWSYAIKTGLQYASPAVADGVIYSGSDDGTVYAFSLSRGDVQKGVAERPELNKLRPDFSLKMPLARFSRQ